VHDRRTRLRRVVRQRLRLAAAPRESDGGSAPVEFVLVGTLVVFLFLGVLQLGLLLHMRNVVVSSAVEAAQAAARADAGCGDGVERFERLVGDALSTRVAAGIGRPVQCRVEVDPSGLPIVRLTARVDLPLVFTPFGSVSVTATGRAVREGR